MNMLKRDAEQAAYHEAGHLAALTVLGGHGQADVFLRDNPAPDDRLVGGQVRIFRWPLDPKAKRLVGLAGVTAGCLADDPDLDVIELEDWLLSDVLGLSESDARDATGWTFDDLEKVLNLLRDNWEDVEREAGCLLEWLEAAA